MANCGAFFSVGSNPAAGFAPWSALVQISAIRDDIRSLVAKLDILTGKVAEIDTRLAVLEDYVK